MGCSYFLVEGTCKIIAKTSEAAVGCTCKSGGATSRKNTKQYLDHNEQVGDGVPGFFCVCFDDMLAKLGLLGCLLDYCNFS